MIEKGFEESAKNLKSEVNRIDQRIGGLESGLNQKIDKLDQKVDGLDKKLDFKFTGLQNQIDNMTLYYTPRSEHNLLKEHVQNIIK